MNILAEVARLSLFKHLRWLKAQRPPSPLVCRKAAEGKTSVCTEKFNLAFPACFVVVIITIIIIFTADSK